MRAADENSSSNETSETQRANNAKARACGEKLSIFCDILLGNAINKLLHYQANILALIPHEREHREERDSWR